MLLTVHRTRVNLVTALGGLAGPAAVLGLIDLIVACRLLPRCLRGVPGDTHPRSTLGAALLLTAAALALMATGAWSRGRRAR